MRTEPNFFMTAEYIRHKGLRWDDQDGLIGWRDPDDPNLWFFPPWMVEQGRFAVKKQRYWAGFPGLPGNRPTELDRQYVYNPLKFQELEGSEWKVYRKNIRKFPARLPVGSHLEYKMIEGDDYEDQIADLVEHWCGPRPTIQDPDVLVRFCLFGWWRWGLFQDGLLVGLNVGDLNWKHVIFRYCLDDGTPFLQEYLRHQFYTMPWTTCNATVGIWVNDGGDLGQEGLRKFKERLNPARIETVYSNEGTE